VLFYTDADQNLIRSELL